MGNAGIGVNVLPLLIEQPIKGGFDSIHVDVVPGRDDEVASVVEAKLTQGSGHLLLVQMSSAPVPDGNKVDLVLDGQLHLDNYLRWTNKCPRREAHYAKEAILVQAFVNTTLHYGASP